MLLRKILILSFLAISGAQLYSQSDSLWSLEKCIDYAFSSNIQIRKSVLAAERSVLNYDQAKAQRFPSVNAAVNQNFGWKNSQTAGAGYSYSNSTGYSLNSGVTLYNGSRLTNLIRQSELDMLSSELTLETARETISLSILDAYLQVLYAEEQVKNSRMQIESTEGQLGLAEERLRMKVISMADYSQVRSQLASEKLTLANSEKQYAIARISLMQLIELPADNNFEIEHPDMGSLLNELRKPDVRSIYETALAVKPQIRNAAVIKQITGLDEKIARAGYIPSLTASAGITTGFASGGTGTYFNQINDGLYPAAGISLAIPIYQRKQVKTSIQIAKNSYSEAELSETDTRNQLRKSIEQACVDVTSAQAEYEASNENYMATLESTALAEEKFNQGIISSVDYLVSKTNLIVAESQLLQSKYNLIYSYKVLDFYEGNPLTL